MISLALFSSAVKLACCAEMRLLSFEISAFNVDSILLLELEASDRMPVVELVPALASMVLKLWPQLFAFWKKPDTLLRSEFITESSELASNASDPSLFTLIPNVVKLLMSDELV